MMKKIKKIFHSIARRPYDIGRAALLLLSAIYGTASLITYNVQDQSFLHYSTHNSSITNAGGTLGANLSALVIYLIGSAWPIFIMFLIFASYMYASGILWKHQLDRIAAFIVFMPTTCTLLARYSGTRQAGLLGYYIFKGASLHVQEPILTITLATLCLMAIIIIFRSILVPCLFISIHAVQWLIAQKAVWHAIGFYCAAMFSWIMHCMSSFLKHIGALLSGSWIAQKAMSIVEFESGSTEEPLLDTAFWQAFLTDIATQEAQKPTRPTTDTITPATTSTEKLDATIEQVTYQLPETGLLNARKAQALDKRTVADMDTQARLLEEKLAHFGIQGSVVGIKRGPVVTLFEYKPDIDARISKITALEDDLALALQALSIRIIAPIPGKSVIGFEVANIVRSTVPFADVLASELFENSSLSLPLALGVDTVGNKVVVDLAKMPHLLIAGSTGSGKSVALQTMIMSLLYKRTPDDLKLILVDPKRLEFASYADIAHLVFPIVMQPKTVLPVLKWVVRQMEERYEMMTSVGARNIGDYQNMARSNVHLDPMPYMVVIIDEFADLMMTCGRDIEDYIARIAQMARAAGIHMIIATQRPSVDVITGLIKVNFPSRISCRVTTKVDSRTILDCNGAEKLLGRGDMLFLDAADSTIKRVHGAYVADAEIASVVNHIKAQKEVQYLSIDAVCPASAEDEETDDLYNDIITYLKEVDEISISLLQRRFKIGYNRSARIIDALSTQGYILPADGSKMRKVVHRP